jgi:type VI secretion system secreted protein Hcp
MYLEIEGVDGESAIKAKAIDIESWSFGMAQQGSGHTGGGIGAGKVNIGDVSIMKRADKASPTLMLKCAKGEHIKKATITCRKAGGDPLIYYVVTMEDVLVTSSQTSGSNGSDTVSESLSLMFVKVKVEYQEQDEKGKAKGGKVEFKWNAAENKPA